MLKNTAVSLGNIALIDKIDPPGPSPEDHLSYKEAVV